MRISTDDPISALVVFFYNMAPAIAPMILPLIVAIWARLRVERIQSIPGGEASLSGSEIAQAMLAEGAMSNVAVVVGTPPLANFADVARNELRLAQPVFEGRSPEALAIASHETGRMLLAARRSWVWRLATPLQLGLRLAGGVSWLCILSGVVLLSPAVAERGARLYLGVVVSLLAFQWIERDANRRARALVAKLELPEMDNSRFRRALDAAGWQDLARMIPIPRRLRSRQTRLVD